MRRRISLPLLLTLLALTLGAGGHAVAQTTQALPQMPRVTGMTAAQAAGVLQKYGLTPVLDSVASDAARGVVVRQQPEAGTPVQRGMRAVLGVSTGPAVATAPVDSNRAAGQTTATTPTRGGIGIHIRPPPLGLVPNLVGMSLAEARITLVSRGLRPGAIDSASADGARPGRIVAQEPAAGRQVLPGSRVRMTIARHAAAPPPPNPASDLLAVPTLAGMSVDQARTTLGSGRLLLGAVDSAAGQGAPGTVIRQKPEAGDSVPPGTFVSITLARTPLVAVPRLAGMRLDSARRVLRTTGLRAGAVTERERPGTASLVLSQSVAPGSQVVPGTVVALVVSKAPAARTDTATGTGKTPARRTDSTAAAGPSRGTVRTPVATHPAATHAIQPAKPARSSGKEIPTRQAPARAVDLRIVLAILALLLAAAAAWVVRRRMRARRPSRTPVPAPATASAAHVRVGEGHGRTLAGSPPRIERGRVKLAVRIAEPAAPRADGGEAAIQPARVVVRPVPDGGGRAEAVDAPETVLAGAAAVVRVEPSEAELEIDRGRSPILTRR